MLKHFWKMSTYCVAGLGLGLDIYWSKQANHVAPSHILPAEVILQ